MSLWNDEKSQQLIAKRLIGASLVWLVIGTVSGAIISLQRVFPWLFENWSWWNLTRAQLYYTSLLLFGFAFPLVLGMWFLRLLQQRKAPIRWLPLWESGYFLWQFALLWGVFNIFTGNHSSLPTWVFPPVIYGMLFVASVMFCAAIALNIPSNRSHASSLSYQFLLAGLCALPLLLLAFLMMSQLRNYIAPSLLQTTLMVALLFPLIGLLLPLSLSIPSAPDYSRLKFFFWAGIFLFPLSSSTFSASVPGHLLLFLFQIGATAAVVALLYTLFSWWRYPNLYHNHWLYQIASYTKGSTAVPAGIHQTSQKENSVYSAQTEEWVKYFQWGGFCLAIAAFESTVFALLRVAGSTPSPTWSSNHLTLLLMGTGLLWLQGIFCLLAPQAQQEQDNLFSLRFSIFAGVLLVSLGSWWEGLLHFYLEQTGLPRGTVFSLSGRWLRFFGHAFLWASIWWFARNMAWIVRNIGPLLEEIQNSHPKTSD